jgi:hypothetical protein
MGQLEGIWNVLRNWIFWRNRQRRGVHVRTLKIGSRGAVFCFGGIWEFHAELRRECVWGNLDLVFFGVLVGVPREGTEGGGTTVFYGVFGGTLNWGTRLNVNGMTYES